MKHLNVMTRLALAGVLAGAPRFVLAQNAANVTQLIRDSQTALAEDKPDEAEKLSRSAVDLDPAHPPAWRQYGLALLRGGKAKEAVTALKRTVEMDENDATAWRGLAMACWQSQQQNEAVRALSSYLRLKPEDASVWRDLAAWLTRLERGDQAIAALERVVELKADDASAWRELGSWLTRLQRNEQAVAALEQATKLKPDDASAWHDLATTLTRLQRNEQAVAALEQATRIKPDNAAFWRELAGVLSALERHEQVVPVLERVVKLTPADATAWRELATALTRIEKFEQAVSALEQAVKRAPKDASAWRALALLHQNAGRVDDALKAFEQALAARPDDAATQRDLGWLLWTQGRRDEALARLTEAVEAGVDGRDRVIYQVAARLSEEGAGDKALDFLRRVNPKEPLSAMGLALARAGRLRAAEPILLSVWQHDEKTPVIGLYLAYARAVNGQFEELAAYLDPLLHSPSALSPEYADLALETLRLGGTRPETPELVNRLEAVLEKTALYSGRVTDLLETAAEASRVRSTSEQALRLYRRVLARDPNRASWIWAVLLAERVEGQTPYAWLAQLEKQATLPARLAGIKGLRADRLGQAEEAIQALRQSLALDPQQPPLRQILFTSLLGQGRVAEARAEVAWFARQVEAGEVVLRSYLAEMLTRLGDTREALAQWELLYQTSPETTYYAIETAHTLYKLGQPDEAMNLLQKVVATNPDHRVFELMAEIAAARARNEEAVEWSARGLAADPSPGLLRAHAENLEALETNAPVALADARAFLRQDPGNVPITLLAGRMLSKVGATNEIQMFYSEKLDRNPIFVPSLTALRDWATQEGRVDDAVSYARTRADIQRENTEALRAYANSLAQQGNFRQALKLLRPMARLPFERAVPILVYSSIARPPYAGRNSVDQISRHIRRLADDGFVFVNAFSQISQNPDTRQIMIVLIDPEPEVIEALDPVLQQAHARVVYAGNAAYPALTLSGLSIPERLLPALASDRWNLASGGPADVHRQPVNTAGVLGSPLTHPLMIGAARETAEAFSARVHQALANAARALKASKERVLVYPSGDFGHRSLDTDTNNVSILREAVAQHFTHALYFDDNGFYLLDPQADPLRIPARTVPPNWDAAALASYLGSRHPLTRAQLELARVLYWNGQHEAAHAAFARAAQTGADSRETTYNWSMNADRQGDLPTALDKLRAAQLMEPDSERVRQALERLNDRKRPQATVFLSGWKDNEDRDHYRYGIFGDAYVSERLRLGVMADRDRWSTQGLGSEYGTRYGVRGLAYLTEQVWLSGSLWQLEMDDLKSHWGGDIALRLPNPWLSGYLYLTAAREEIETVEALRAHIDANTYALRTYTRLMDVFDLFADVSETVRSDGNNTSMLDGRLLYRLNEWPYVGIGWRFRIADSDRDPPEYWAPEQLQQHQAHITVRGSRGRLSGALSAEAGYAQERDTQWQFVWGARGTGNLALTRSVSLSGDLGYFESTNYQRMYGRIGLTGRF